MTAEADAMASIDLASLSDEELAGEIARRTQTLSRWEEVYYRDFIPLAHGVRLFGQVYNDQVRPADPYEFVDLLAGSGLMSVSRNAALEELAARIAPEPSDLTEALDDYLDRFGSGPGTPESVRARERDRLIRLVRALAEKPGPGSRPAAASPAEAGKGTVQAEALDRTEEYLSRFRGEERRFQEELLDLARASYRLRDDDNLYLGRFQQLTEAALAAARDRAGELPLDGSEKDRADGAALGDSPEGAADKGRSENGGTTTKPAPRFRVRQLVGQPAGPGLAVGRARVCLDEDDLYAFSRAEVLVCDSLDPTMTFVAPLAAAIVERRGGMLVHGAIIAREYGLPCVTGVPEATRDIRTGDLLTVDGFLGIVVVGGTPPGSMVG
jgi:pyruvate,water dikinase